MLLNAGTSNAQFISRGTILYEVKTNLKKTLGNSSWGEGMMDKIPAVKSSFFKLSFSGNHTQYVFDHYDDKDKMTISLFVLVVIDPLVRPKFQL